MKALRIMLAGLLAFAAASCGGGYDKSTCEELQTQISSGTALSADNVDKLIDQLDDLVSQITKSVNDVNGDPDKAAALLDDGAFKQKLEFVEVFARYLDSNRKTLTEKQISRLDAIEANLKN